MLVGIGKEIEFPFTWTLNHRVLFSSDW